MAAPADPRPREPDPARDGQDPPVEPRRLELVAAAVTAAAGAPGLDRLVRMASRLLRVPVAMVSFIDAGQEVIQAAVGLPEPWASLRTAPLTHALCARVVRGRGAVIIADARNDPEFRDHAAVVEMGAGAYAGYPLHHDGEVLGAFCAADTGPRAWTADDLELLEDLAAAVSAELCLRIALHDLRESQRQLRNLTRELHEQSRTDPLTGVANRRAFEERLAEEAARVQRHPAALSLALVDVDRFKQINDTAGHQVGDAVLVGVASRARAALRRTDLIARLGGDEFALLLPATGERAAARLAERVHRAVEDEPVEGVAVTVAVGTATHRPPQTTAELYAAADAALYAAKAARTRPDR